MLKKMKLGAPTVSNLQNLLNGFLKKKTSTCALRNNPPVLPPKIGEGVLGSSSGGVNPTGASFAGGASVFSSAAATFKLLCGMEIVSGLGVKANDEVGFHGARVFGVVMVGVKRPA